MKRDWHGVLLLDKPEGDSSNGALQKVKRLFKAAKAGHTGSLDPKASGMLPLCLGEATKFSQFLLEADKRYLVVGKLGETTASGDSETPVLASKDWSSISLPQIEAVLPQFRGTIAQVPPMYSALKHHGEPLYKLARQGIEIEREPREVRIHELTLLKFADGLVHFEVFCSKGTYVRTLIVDIGAALGCGAHVVALRRLEVGPYRADQMIALEQIQEAAAGNHDDKLKALLLPVESMLLNVPELILTPDMEYYIRLGSPVLIPKAPTSGLVRLRSKDERFLGVGEIMLDGMVAPKRMVSLKSKGIRR